MLNDDSPYELKTRSAIWSFPFRVRAYAAWRGWHRERYKVLEIVLAGRLDLNENDRAVLAATIREYL